MNSILARISGLTLLVGLVVLLFLGKCTHPVAPQKAAVSWLNSAPVKPVHDTVVVTKIVEKVVVQKLYLPRVHDTVRMEVPRYYVKTKYIEVAAKADSTGMTIDSLTLFNTKTMIAFNDYKGNVTFDVQNSSPHFKSANVNAYVYHMEVLSRWSYGPYVGVGLTPTGAVVPTLGFGLMYNLNKRK